MKLRSEEFPPGGTISAKGAKESLGRPHLDHLLVLVREAVQNSWDARSEDHESIEFDLAGVSVPGD